MHNICINVIVTEGKGMVPLKCHFLFLSDNPFPQVHILIILGQPVMELSPFFSILV